jgi:outer membrane protein assembly factor BamB
MLRWLPPILALLGVAAFGVWLAAPSPVTVTNRVPDPSTAALMAAKRGDPTLGKLTTGDGQPAELPGEWPCFRGWNRDNIAGDEGIKLARAWPERGPRKLWDIAVGEGYAGPAVWSGRVYLMDYDRENQSDALRCFSLGDGKEIWRYSYPIEIKRNHGMSRTVPAVTDKFVVAMGPKCHVTCFESVTGKLLWAKDLVTEFGTTVPQWYAGQCPLIEDGRVILAPCGKDAMLVAVDCATGRILWKTSNPRSWEMTHTSIVPMTFQERKMYVYGGSGGVAGVAAENGELLWDTTQWTIKIAAIASPIPIGDGRIFLSGGYDAGAAMLRLNAQNGKFTPEILYRLKENVFGATQQTPIFSDGNIYGVRPNGELACLDLDGKVRWTSGVANKFGLGAFLMAGKLLYVVDDDGKMVMADVNSTEYRPLATAKVLAGHEAWGPMALAGGRLLVRDFARMVCLDVAEGQE